jgi:hypothetical protein
VGDIITVRKIFLCFVFLVSIGYNIFHLACSIPLHTGGGIEVIGDSGWKALVAVSEESNPLHANFGTDTVMVRFERESFTRVFTLGITPKETFLRSEIRDNPDAVRWEDGLLRVKVGSSVLTLNPAMSITDELDDFGQPKSMNLSNETSVNSDRHKE